MLTVSAEDLVAVMFSRTMATAQTGPDFGYMVVYLVLLLL